MKFIWIEILKFLKNNKIKLIVGTLLITLLFVGSSYWNSYKSSQPANKSTETVEDSSRTSENNNEENELVEFYPETRPANFYFFVENVDQTAFTNNLLLEQYITSPRVISKASEETNTNLDEIVEMTGNKAYVDYNESGETKAIGVGRNADTHLFEFHVNVGNKTDNLRIANYFYEIITDNEIQLLNDKQIYVFQEPQIKDVDEIPAFEDSTEQTSVNEFNLFQDILIGLIIGSAVSIGLLLLLSFLSKQLVYNFSYSLNYDDYFFLVDNKINYQEELKQLLLKPSTSNIVLVNEDNILSESIEKIVDDNEISSYKNLTEINDINNVDRLIYIINENKTTRAWYNNQRRMERSYDIPVVVIQFNEI